MDIRIPDYIKGFIFDLDGTLVDTMPMHTEAWVSAGKYFNVEITPYMVQAMAGIPTLQLVVRLNQIYGWELDPLEVKVKKDRLLEEIKLKKGPYQAIEPVMQIVRNVKDSKQMTVGTGSSRTQAIRILREMGIIDWFTGIVGAEDVTSFKPDPETFLKCASLMRLEPMECIVFEDGDLGILAAKNAGMEYVDIRQFQYV